MIWGYHYFWKHPHRGRGHRSRSGTFLLLPKTPMLSDSPTILRFEAMEPECFYGPFNPSTGPINPDLTRIWIFSQQTVQAQIPHILQVFGWKPFRQHPTLPLLPVVLEHESLVLIILGRLTLIQKALMRFI